MASKPSLESLFGAIDEQKTDIETPKPPTLDEMRVDQIIVDAIDEWANPEYGLLATYIPELERVNPDRTAIAVGDLYGNMVVTGDGQEETPSTQSDCKPFLFVFTQIRGIDPTVIAGMEATALPFNADEILRPELHLRTASHPLNNAGAISSAGAIDDFDEYLAFMRKATGNPNLQVLTNVFESEMGCNSNNRAIAERLAAAGRFSSSAEAQKAVENYTRACAIGMTVKDAMRACLTLANGGLTVSRDSQERLFSEDAAVRAMNAMNSFGMYEQTGQLALMVSGSRANTCKSGVGGVVVNVNPGVGAFATYSPLLNTAGNSVHGFQSMIALNRIFSLPGRALRLTAAETARLLAIHDRREGALVHENVINEVTRRRASGASNMDSRFYRLNPEMLEATAQSHRAALEVIGILQRQGS